MIFWQVLASPTNNWKIISVLILYPLATQKSPLKKLLFPLFSLFLISQSYELLRLIWVVPREEYSLLLSLLMATLVNLFVTGIFAFLGFAFPTNTLLPKSYYKIQNPDRLKKFAKFLHLDLFKKVLLLLFWGREKNRKKYFDGTPSGLENFDFQVKQSEVGHVMALVLILLYSLVMVIKQHYLMASFTLVINIIFNLYPVILQRTHRIQLNRILKIQKKEGTQ